MNMIKHIGIDLRYNVLITLIHKNIWVMVSDKKEQRSGETQYLDYGRVVAM